MRLEKPLPALAEGWRDEVGPLPAELAPLDFILHPDRGRYPFQLAMLGRFIFSSQVDTDFRDTEDFYAEVRTMSYCVRLRVNGRFACASGVLAAVDYVIEAVFEMTARAGPGDNEGKHLDSFRVSVSSQLKDRIGLLPSPNRLQRLKGNSHRMEAKSAQGGIPSR